MVFLVKARESELSGDRLQCAIQAVRPPVKGADKRPQWFIGFQINQRRAAVTASVHKCAQDTVVVPNDDVGLAFPVANQVTPGLANAANVSGNQRVI